MNLCIQDPSWPQSDYLLERIIEASTNANFGAAAFAFASTGGVRLLLRDEGFGRFLARARFELLVGVDAVTNVAALELMRECTVRHTNLIVRVFHNNIQDSLFHPKICWFRGAEQTVCLAGSGNLTPGGLRGNREVFALNKLEGQEAGEFSDAWLSWITFHQTRLLPPDHPAVITRARRNRGSGLPRDGRKESLVEDRNGRISVGLPRSDTDAVLIVEIPRSGSRWNQANFHLDTFQNFFGATPGQTQRIILTHVSTAGQIGDEEIRPSVAVSSHNFRFELGAASGLQYPQNGRPIAVFVRVATRTFRYRLLMPGTLFHDSANDYLNRNSPATTRGLRRHITSVGSVRQKRFFNGLATAMSA